MSETNLRNWSRGILVTPNVPTTEQAILGCLQRIADALERQNAALVDRIDTERRRNDRLQERIRRLERSLP